MSSGVHERAAPRSPRLEVEQRARRVTFSPSGITVLVEPGETVVDGLRRQGLRTRYKCRRGGCGVCRATVLSGQVTYPTFVSQDVIAGDATCSEEHDQCLPCRAVPETDVHLLLGPKDKVIDVLGGVLPRASTTTHPSRPVVGSHERNHPCPS